MHPFQKYREHGTSQGRVRQVLKESGGAISHGSSRNRMRQIQKESGGAIDEDIDVRSREEMPTSVGPYGLGRAMQHEKSVQDYKEVSEGKRFYDTGTRIPGQQKAKNDAYSERRRRRD